ncbi:metal ABC transporter substrate-binding protein [Limimaricola cinnabarinus]|jgi:manganese/iron transport system substrate-binding protein|uniref:Manganese ABC transporter, periplasmic-binding protein SitA n=1 Tax=Limimaricola cinnabarinus LL-001 TaxID=1337093 RepID=U2YZ40_9RHOB|nr:metal ABC transporter substrate-binding protein [Limimaricola cinnabarinus]GAD54330.1 manganese ABC transporter, periplasmic-binding protein SitA [Limimaricola cinnabarinus LL-001]
MRTLPLLALGASLLALPAAAEDKIKVATSFTVIADMVANVAGDAAEVVSITKPGAEIHNYQPTPRDILGVRDADLVLWNGLNLELWFEQFLDNAGDRPTAVISEGIEPISISGGDYDGKPNPHAWMSPDNAAIYVDNIRDALSEADPENAETYAAHAASYKEEIAAVIEPLRAEIARVPEDKRWLVSCEGAFSYLARDLGLNELYLWPINADATGTPQQVRKVIDGVREHEIPAVFCESTVNTDPAKQVARETGAAYGGELYVDSLSGADGPVPSYLDLLRVTTETVARGLNGVE